MTRSTVPGYLAVAALATLSAVVPLTSWPKPGGAWPFCGGCAWPFWLWAACGACPGCTRAAGGAARGCPRGGVGLAAGLLDVELPTAQAMTPAAMTAAVAVAVFERDLDMG